MFIAFTHDRSRVCSYVFLVYSGVRTFSFRCPYLFRLAISSAPRSGVLSSVSAFGRAMALSNRTWPSATDDESAFRPCRTTIIELEHWSGWIIEGIHGTSMQEQENGIVCLTSVTILWRRGAGGLFQERHALDHKQHTNVIIGGTTFKRTWRPLSAVFVAGSRASHVAVSWGVVDSKTVSCWE